MKDERNRKKFRRKCLTKRMKAKCGEQTSYLCMLSQPSFIASMQSDLSLWYLEQCKFQRHESIDRVQCVVWENTKSKCWFFLSKNFFGILFDWLRSDMEFEHFSCIKQRNVSIDKSYLTLSNLISPAFVLKTHIAKPKYWFFEQIPCLIHLFEIVDHLCMWFRDFHTSTTITNASCDNIIGDNEQSYINTFKNVAHTQD